jgi:hypothetical protein
MANGLQDMQLAGRMWVSEMFADTDGVRRVTLNLNVDGGAADISINVRLTGPDTTSLQLSDFIL